MKKIAMVFFVLFIVSCTGQHEDKGNIIASNPYLIGKWTGEEFFLDSETNRKFGKVTFEIEIKEDNEIIGTIGEARLTNTSIAPANYGFEIRGILNEKIKSDSDLNKDHLIILLVLPEENREEATRSDANFHLKSNYVFDSTLKVGGVMLTKDHQQER